MKSFLLFDDYSEYYDLTDYKGLRKLLIDELERDTMECGVDDFDIVKNNFKIMKELTKDEYNLGFIRKELEAFGWYIQDLSKLQEDLSNFQAYKNGVGCPIIKDDCIEQTLKMIESEMK